MAEVHFEAHGLVPNSAICAFLARYLVRVGLLLFGLTIIDALSPFLLTLSPLCGPCVCAQMRRTRWLRTGGRPCPSSGRWSTAWSTRRCVGPFCRVIYIYIYNGDGNQRVDQTMHYKVKAATYSEAT